MKRVTQAAVLAATLLAMIAAGGVITGPRAAQANDASASAAAAAKTLTADSFEQGLTDWVVLKSETGKGLEADNDSKLTLTTSVRQGGGGVNKNALSYAYEITPGTIRGLALTRPLNLAGMKSVRFWVRSEDATALMFGLGGSDSVPYQTGFYVPEGVWQEVAINLDDLAPDNGAAKTPGKLDLASVRSLHVADMGSLLVSLVPALKGPRTLMIDDVVFSPEPVPGSGGLVTTPGAPDVYRADNFETPLIRWIPLSLQIAEPVKIGLFDAPVAIDTMNKPAEGRGSLKYSYKRQAGKAYGLLRNLQQADLKTAKSVRLRLQTALDGTYLVSIEEKDGSRYQQAVTLKAAEFWGDLTYTLAGFTLADDSKDENANLDPGQIKEISIADVTNLFDQSAEEKPNVLWVDDVRFVL